MSEELAKTTRPAADESGRAGRPEPGEAEAYEIRDWLCIEPDGTVEVYTGKVEVGQNIRTSLSQAVAEELRLPLDAIRLVMADTDRAPFDAGTVGSRTTPAMASLLHTVAAATRELLVDLAAERWQVERDTLLVGGGKVSHPASGRVAGYGELCEGRELAYPYGDDAPVTEPDRWTIAGTTVAKVDGRSFVTGRHRYTPDLTRPGMLIGMVLRPPAFGATLKSLDTRAAAALPGVQIVKLDGLTGIVAPTRHAALRAIATVRAEWEIPEQINSDELFDYLRRHPAPSRDQPGYLAAPPYQIGSIEAGLSVADRVITQTYTVAYIAHAPLESRAALAEWRGDRLTVWTGTQRPFGVRSELATVFGIPEEDIRVIVPDTGGAYGGKHTGEVAVEAARLARATGRPIKIIWTREEEFTWAYFRPAGIIDITSGVRDDGTLVAWEHHTYNSGPSAIRTLYDIPNQRIAFHPTLGPLRQGSYRALAATANTFARETHMDELACDRGQDPLAYRLQHLRDDRLRAVLIAAAECFGWQPATVEPGHGIGIAGGSEKDSYVATCAEVAIDRETGQVRVVRVAQAYECGTIVNPDGLRSQNVGAIIQGLGAALYEAIDFADGTILTNRFSSYRVPRFADIPPIEVVLLDRRDLPSVGAGETPIIGIAPAIGNAIFDASGIRLRSMPLLPTGSLPS